MIVFINDAELDGCIGLGRPIGFEHVLIDLHNLTGCEANLARCGQTAIDMHCSGLDRVGGSRATHVGEQGNDAIEALSSERLRD